MNRILKAAVGTALFGVAGMASATNFFLCPPSAGGGCTDTFEQATVFIASNSNYTDNDTSGGISAGDSVIDNGLGNVTGFQPFTGGVTETQAFNTDWFLNISFDNIAQVVVAVDDSLAVDPGNTPDNNGTIGETVGVASQILSGSIGFYYTEPGGGFGTLVAELTNLSGTSTTVGNIVIDGNVDFSNVAAADIALAQSLLFFEGGASWYDIWLAGGDTSISSRFDTNIDQLEVQDGVGDFDFLRTTELDGSVRFEVPVPAPLALVGLGLIGLGFARRKQV